MASGLKCLLAAATAATVAAGASVGGIPSVSHADVPPEKHESYVVGEGTVTFDFDTEALEWLGIVIIARGEADGPREENRATFPIEASSTLQVETLRHAFRGIVGGVARTQGAFLLDTPVGRAVIGNLVIGVDSDGVYTVSSTLNDRDEPRVAFELTSVEIDFSAYARQLVLIGELSITESWAWMLGMPEAADTLIGAMVLDVEMLPSDTDGAVVDATCGGQPRGNGREADVSIGPDVIIGDLQGVMRHDEVDGITAFSVATNACNLGDWHASWIAETNKHPLIFSSMFRLKDDRFEQIGMSWVKHGFYAVAQNLCGDPPECYCQEYCKPNDPDRPPDCMVYCDFGRYLAIGCSDPYSASLNGIQTNMSPRYLVNGHTGVYPFPWEGWSDPEWDPESPIERRLQVHNEDLDPLLNADATYFVQGHYILSDDAMYGNSNNNTSYRQVDVTKEDGQYIVIPTLSCSTQRGQAAIRAWQDYDPLVVETDIQVPNEGLFILAAKVTYVDATGYWRYSYALENLNSDRSAMSFTVPKFPGTAITEVGFHDVDYHSGEPYDLTDWLPTVEEHSITWSTETYAENQNANALRFSTLYNFYFDASVPPAQGRTIRIDLFKLGQPEYVECESIAPSSSVSDCNGNEITDDCDVDCGEPGGPCDILGCGGSSDCDENGIPDECQLDCNDNGVADTCDIMYGTSDDCNDNVIPDECETDCNDNGVPDDCDVDPSDPDGDGQVSEDCQQNGVPDECDADCDGDGIPSDCDVDEDTDGDGVDDCLDECAYTTPKGGCHCPDKVCCDHPIYGPCFWVIEPYICISAGGTPACIPGDVCRDGCLYGDLDRDGDFDLLDVAEFQVGFSGPDGEPGFETPSMGHLFAFDRNDDGDIDLTDYEKLGPTLTGPRILGDFDRDRDLDLADIAVFQIGFSGPLGEPGFETPRMNYLLTFDSDNDGDIDLTDHQKLQRALTGP